jgi:hypothetical protein
MVQSTHKFCGRTLRRMSRSVASRASWVDQAELLNHAFDCRYLKRG